MSKIDHLLDQIRRSCELGEIGNVISLSEELKKTTLSNPEDHIEYLVTISKRDSTEIDTTVFMVHENYRGQIKNPQDLIKYGTKIDLRELNK